MNNLAVRTISGAVFAAVMLAAFLLNHAVFVVVFLVVLVISMREFFSISMGGRFPLQQKLAVVAAGLTFIASCGMCLYGLPAVWISGGLLALMAIPVSLLFLKDRSDLDVAAYLFTAVLYVGLPLVLSPMLMKFTVGPGLPFLLCMFLIVWGGDVAAYCVGTAFGQKPDSRKLAPSISPRKSWWGFWGAVFFSVVIAVVEHLLGWLDIPVVHCAAIGAVVSVSAVAGDLYESVWKRHFGVKDSGNCIPGHGGMLDRFDSSFFVIPVITAYLAIAGLI